MITQVTKGFPRSPTTNTRDFLIKRGLLGRWTRELVIFSVTMRNPRPPTTRTGDSLGHLRPEPVFYSETLGFPRPPEPVTTDFQGQQGFSSVTRVHSRRFTPCKGSCHVGGAIRDNYQGLVSDPKPLPPYYTAELLLWFLRKYTQIPLHPPKSRNDPRNHRNGSTTTGKTK